MIRKIYFILENVRDYWDYNNLVKYAICHSIEVINMV